MKQPWKILEYAGTYAIIKEVGIRNFRKITERFPVYNWYRLNKEMKEIEIDNKIDVFGTIRRAIEKFETIELENYKDKI